MLSVGRDFFARFEAYLQRQGFMEERDMEETDEDAWFVRGTKEPSWIERPAPPAAQRTSPTSVVFGGFSIHAGVTVGAQDHEARLRLCRYVLRPPLAEDQLSRMRDGRIRLELKKKTRAGQTHIVLSGAQLVRHLAWLIPPPGQHQIRLHGALAPHAKVRPRVVPTREGETLSLPVASMRPIKTDRASWARLLARVYHIDALRCPNCGGRLIPVGAVLGTALPKERLHTVADPPQLSFAF